MTLSAFDHYTIRCADLDRSWRFYADVLGFRVVARPIPNTPAAIAYLGDTMMIHLFQAGPDLEQIFSRLKAPDPEAAAWGTGRLHHIAFQARDLPAIRAQLTRHGIAFTERTLASQSKHLVVLKDPDSVEIELSFALEKLNPA